MFKDLNIMNNNTIYVQRQMFIRLVNENFYTHVASTNNKGVHVIKALEISKHLHKTKLFNILRSTTAKLVFEIYHKTFPTDS
jgi:hypothetical protein